MSVELRDLFLEMNKAGASDLHLVVGAPPQIRVSGSLKSVSTAPSLTGEMTRELVYGILNNEQRQQLENDWEIDFSYSIPGIARWRVNAFYQQGNVGAAFRIIPEEILPISKLSVPDVLYELCDLPRGLVLVTGPTGSGKSTTLAAMLDVINEQRNDHILTVEDPVEFIHQHKNCIVNQREVHADTESFARALKSALRQDPDVILVGEMRDLETIGTALTAAETGHLVFGTLHTNSAAKTVDRVIDVFPPHQQAQVRVQLASGLQGVISQTLLPRKDGNGRIAACEVMIPNAAIRNLIREGKIFQIPSVMQTSQEAGMQTLDAALATLVRQNVIDEREAVRRCHEPAEFQRLLASGAGAPPTGRVRYESPAELRLKRKFKSGEGVGARASQQSNVSNAERQRAQAAAKAALSPDRQAPANPAPMQFQQTPGAPGQPPAAAMPAGMAPAGHVPPAAPPTGQMPPAAAPAPAPGAPAPAPQAHAVPAPGAPATAVSPQQPGQPLDFPGQAPPPPGSEGSG